MSRIPGERIHGPRDSYLYSTPVDPPRIKVRDWKQINPTKIEINFTVPKRANSITAVLSRNGQHLHTLPMDGDVRQVWVVRARPGVVYKETFNVDYYDGSKDSTSVNVWTTN